MSVQFGTCNFDGKPVDPQDLDEVRLVLAPYGPDGESCISKGNYAILYRALHTTKESHREKQPYVSKFGAIITWDGRLDNRKDLIERLAGGLSPDSTDLEIVAAGYDRWETDSLRDLIGDWALSVWNPKIQSLVLAKDFVGTRHLYYSVEKDRVTWCTILDPLVLLARHPLKLEEEYIAGWLSFFPATHLTPYVGIHAVPASSFVRITRRTEKVTKYWDFDPARRIRYRTEVEYEEHFRAVFLQSVRRRLRSDSPVLAELSGGMDSSSIVCMADAILAKGIAETPRLDTISYYDDSEPNWNERPYFAEVEKQRGRQGCHIKVGSNQGLRFDLGINQFRVTPGSCFAAGSDQRLPQWTKSKGYRTLLSGTGGDEVTGGVPMPIAELADLVVRMRLKRFAHQLKQWALIQRKPWLHLLLQIVRSFCPPTLVGVAKHRQPPVWLKPHFANRYRNALAGYELRWRLFGRLPSFQESMSSLEALRRQLACFAPNSRPVHEECYPYLDRDFLEFVFAVPPQQLLRPGERRSLMRRSMRGIVPELILNRKRKANVSRAPRLAFSPSRLDLSELSSNMRCSALGIADPEMFLKALKDASIGKNLPVVPLLRLIGIEVWLRTIDKNHVVADCGHGSYGADSDHRQIMERSAQNAEIFLS